MELLFTKEKISLSFILLAGVFLFFAGIFSDLYLGDETFHYRFASYIYETKSRPLYDPLTGHTEAGKIYYIVEPLWHIGLAIFWGLTGGVSKTGAQLYHSLWYIFLLIWVYLLTKELYSEERAVYSVFLVGSIPLLVALSIILHLDVPLMALITFCFLMIIKRHFFWAGIILGLSFWTKRNSLFFVPPIILYILGDRDEQVKQKLKHLFILGITSLLVISPDLYYRAKNFGLASLYSPIPLNLEVPPLKEFSKPSYPQKYIFYDYSNILYNPFSIVRDFGPLLLFSLGLYPLQKKFDKKERLLLFGLLIYIILSIYFFYPNLSLRYFLPIAPFLAVIGSGSFTLIKREWLKYLLILGCAIQFIVVTGYTYSQRKIPRPVMQAYKFVRENTPTDARVMTPKNSLALYTERVAMWTSYVSLGEMPYLFWDAEEKEALKILERYKIGYIFVDKDRVYDDTGIGHQGGYPKSFLSKMSTWPSFKIIFDNEAVSIWKINY